jgi:hypothetical protein
LMNSFPPVTEADLSRAHRPGVPAEAFAAKPRCPSR